MATRPTEPALPRAWPLLFPATFLAHIAEEYFGGFPAWADHWLGFNLTPSTFLAINAYAWCAMCAASIAAMFGRAWLVVPFATITLVNGCAHLLMSIGTRSYSPGLITGALLWIPLGAYTLERSRDGLSSAMFWCGVSVGLALHGIVVLLARSA